MADDASPTPGTQPHSSARSTPAKDRLATLFPDADGRSRRRWYNHKGRVAVVVVIVMALIAGTAVVAGALGSSNPDYRTAVVGTHAVEQAVSGVATIEPVSQATVAFPTSGTVSTVDVKTGDSVVVGQPLASLDTAALTITLHTAQASLAQAQLTLSKALAGQSVTGTGTGVGASAGSGSVGATNAAYSTASSVKVVQVADPTATTAAPAAGGIGPGTGTGTGTTTTDPQLTAAQQAVLAAQKNVDAAIATANTALTSATTICAAAGVSTTASTATPAATTTTAAGGTSTPSTTPTPEQLAACQTATKSVLTAQTAVSTAQNELATASTALDTLLAQRAAGSGSGSSTPTTAPSTGTRSGGTTGGAPTGSSGSTKSTAPSAADLVKYQAAVDAAASQVAVAQQAIDQATISTPIAGTVVAVNLKAGDAVTADSSTANIVVKGEGGYEVSTTVSVTTIPEIKVGQPATVIPDGSTKALVGTVSSISVAPSTSSTTTSYTVVVGLTSDDADLLNGATGSVTIVTGHAASALAVPTSAVTTTGAKHTVKVLNGSKATVTTVKVGVVGDTWTEIKSGVNAGQTVVLANINQSLPGSATTATTSAANTIVSRIQGLARTGGGFGGGAGGFTPPNR